MDAGRVMVTGATGLVGRRLVPAILDAGLRVRAVTRAPGRGAAKLDPRAEVSAWDGLALAPGALDGVAGVVHLAGEPIAGGLPTAARLRRIRASRIDSTRRLVEAIAARPADARPEVLVCASAVGIYGARGEEPLDESAPPGSGFLAELCADWEAEAAKVEAAGVRRVSLRFGVVLAREGGALPLMARPFRLGLGGKLGDGRQWSPWIHVADAAALTLHALREPRLRGPVNAVAPQAVRNADLTRALARRLRRPAVLRVPAFALRALLGEIAVELLGSKRVVPRAAEAAGFRFARPELESALAAELGPAG
jgi:uncharacterized protein (TIGR01777 family)